MRPRSIDPNGVLERRRNATLEERRRIPGRRILVADTRLDGGVGATGSHAECVQVTDLAEVEKYRS